MLRRTARRQQPPRRVLRKPALAAFSVVFLAVPGSVCLVLLLSGPFGLWAIVSLAGLAFTLFMMWRVSVLGVVLDHDGVTVRNYFRSIRLDWSQIVAVEPPRGRGLAETGVRLVRADGSVVRCVGLQPGNAEPLSASDRFVHALAAAVREHRGE